MENRLKTASVFLRLGMTLVAKLLCAGRPQRVDQRPTPPQHCRRRLSALVTHGKKPIEDAKRA